MMYEQYPLSWGYCSNKCKNERKIFSKKNSVTPADRNTHKDVESNPNQILYDKDGKKYASEISKRYSTSEQAQKAEFETRFRIKFVGLIGIFLGVLLCFVGYLWVGIALLILGSFIRLLSGMTFQSK